MVYLQMENLKLWEANRIKTSQKKKKAATIFS